MRTLFPCPRLSFVSHPAAFRPFVSQHHHPPPHHYSDFSPSFRKSLAKLGKHSRPPHHTSLNPGCFVQSADCFGLKLLYFRVVLSAHLLQQPPFKERTPHDRFRISFGQPLRTLSFFGSTFSAVHLFSAWKSKLVHRPLILRTVASSGAWPDGNLCTAWKRRKARGPTGAASCCEDVLFFVRIRKTRFVRDPTLSNFRQFSIMEALRSASTHQTSTPEISCLCAVWDFRQVSLDSRSEAEQRS